MPYRLAMEKPGEWIRSSDCDTDEQRAAIDETGGMLQWCRTCEMFNSPNRPCFCGCIILQRKSDGLFWGGEHGWIEYWKFHAEHHFALNSAKIVAQALCDSVGEIAIYIVHSGWREEEPEECV